MATREKPVTWDALPLYATDAQIGEALLGKTDAWKWSQIMVPALERRGLPALSAYVGKRYCPAVRLFLDRQEGMAIDGHPTRRWTENFNDEGSGPRRSRHA